MNRYPAIFFCRLFLCGIFFSTAYAQVPSPLTAPQKTTPNPGEIQTVINTLENPEARERLIGELKLLAKAQQKQAESKEKPTLGSTTVDVMKSLSEKLTKSAETTVKAVTLFHRLPRVGDWLERQITNLDRRNLWLGIIKDLTGVIGTAYLVFYLLRRLLNYYFIFPLFFIIVCQSDYKNAGTETYTL